MAEHNLLGAWGEMTAANFLRRKWYRIVSAGYQCRFGELDLVARRWPYLVFVEVKTRKNADIAEAREFVTWEKQQRIKAAASCYLQERPTRLQPRFDVIEIYAPEGIHTTRPEINHLEDAYQ